MNDHLIVGLCQYLNTGLLLYDCSPDRENVTLHTQIPQSTSITLLQWQPLPNVLQYDLLEKKVPVTN